MGNLHKWAGNHVKSQPEYQKNNICKLKLGASIMNLE